MFTELKLSLVGANYIVLLQDEFVNVLYVFHQLLRIVGDGNMLHKCWRGLCRIQEHPRLHACDDLVGGVLGVVDFRTRAGGPLEERRNRIQISSFPENARVNVLYSLCGRSTAD